MCAEQRHWALGNSDGKGTLGCLFSLVLLAVGIIAGIKVIPVYYSASSFETDVKTEVSRAGAHFYDDDTLVKDIIQLGKKNEIYLTAENVRLERIAGQIYVYVHWAVPVDLIVVERELAFDVKASSYIGRL